MSTGSAVDFIRFAGNARDVIVVLSLSGRVLAASDSVTPILGWSPDLREGTSIVDYLHPQSRDRAVALLRDSLSTSITEPVELSVIRKDGSIVDMEVLARGFPDDRYIVLTGRDISDRKRLDAERRRNEVRFEGLAKSAPVAILRLDADGSCEFVNDQWTDLTGQSLTDALGDGWTQMIDHLDRDKLARDEGSNEIRVIDLALTTLDGSTRSVVSRWTRLVDELGAQLGFVGTMEDITERKALEAKLSHQATHDSLTGLPNRVILHEHLNIGLARSKRTDERVGVIFFDLDRFKIVNDSLGHETGDRLLVAVASRIKSVMRSSDVLGRFGGDEFVVIATGLNEDTIRDVGERLQAAFHEPFDIGIGRPYPCTSSIGIALSNDSSTPESLMRDADVAMYRAKERGRGRSEEFDDRLRIRALDRLSLEADLPSAILNDELTMLYQPIIDASTGEVFGVEALVRWDHPTRGRLSPDVFISIAEESGIIVQLGDWILRRACRDLAGSRLQLNVNLSARQVADAKLAQRIAAVLESSGFEPHRLVLEITESILLSDLDATTKVLNQLKLLGVSIAVDDFGTGYSSLNYLSRFPVDSLKVDRSFVQGLGQVTGDSEIVRAVIALAHALGLEATAEGVETESQFDTLRGLGCDSVQGFLFDQPVTFAELRERAAIIH